MLGAAAARSALDDPEQEAARVKQTDKEIGELMNLSRWTIVAHMQSAKSKLHVANKPAAIARALELNLFERYDQKL